MKTLGVIGGMGPAATANFYSQFVKCCISAGDQSHPDAIILSLPSIPDRTAFILGKSDENPLGRLLDAAGTLAGLGAGLIAMPCVTAHYFYDEIVKDLEIPFLHIVKETAEALLNNGNRRAGLLATSGTVSSGIFHRELSDRGIDVLTPSKHWQEKLMAILYDDIKAGKPADMDTFYEISNALLNDGAETLILGCTELSLINADGVLDGPYIDADMVLARRAAQICCGQAILSACSQNVNALATRKLFARRESGDAAYSQQYARSR